VHEAYLSEEGLIEHNEHVVAARDAWFRDFAFDHRMSVYGEISHTSAICSASTPEE
jgi:hypothetical protein